MTNSFARLLATAGVCAAVAAGTSACNKPAATTSTTDSTGASAAATTSGNTPTEQANIDTTRKFISEVFEKGNMAFAAAHMDSNVIEHHPMPGYPPGMAGFSKMVADMRSAFPDLKSNIDDIFAKGDMVVMRSTMTGTNTGPFMGMPPTGKKIHVEGIDILRIKNGKAVEHWGLEDDMAMMQQMGMTPPPGGAPPAGGNMNGNMNGASSGAVNGNAPATPPAPGAKDTAKK